MGVVCFKEKQSTKHKSNKCSNCRKNTQKQHLRTFQTCDHYICKPCLSINNSTQNLCPMDHKIQNKNISMQMQKKTKNTSKNNNQDQQQTQLCSNYHKMKWKNSSQTCSVCNFKTHGFKCGSCNEFICTLCAQSFNTKQHKCPNKHPMIWKSTNNACLVCRNKKHGWTCKQCNWFICSQCSGTQFNTLQCPNLHKLIWSLKKHDCTICKQKNRCFQCKSCKAFYCIRCSNYQFSKKECPNKHQTHFIQKHVCTRCDLDMPGMICQECSYHYCTRCDLQQQSSNTKPLNQNYKSIKTIVQNPLLKSQQKEKKSFIDITKKTYNLNVNMQKQQKPAQKIMDSQKLKDQLAQNPQNIDLYLQLAEVYRLQQNFTNQIRMYQEAWDAQDQKQDKNPIVLCSVGEKGLERSIELKYRKSGIIILSKLIGMAEKCWHPQIQNKKTKWQLQKVEQLLISKEVAKAKQEFQKLSGDGQQYQRVKRLIDAAKV